MKKSYVCCSSHFVLWYFAPCLLFPPVWFSLSRYPVRSSFVCRPIVFCITSGMLLKVSDFFQRARSAIWSPVLRLLRAHRVHTVRLVGLRAWFPFPGPVSVFLSALAIGWARQWLISESRLCLSCACLVPLGISLALQTEAPSFVSASLFRFSLLVVSGRSALFLVDFSVGCRVWIVA
jgi:hypothetical protein